MSLKLGKIIVHRADMYSETDGSVSSSDDAEVAEIAENADFKYSKKTATSKDRQKRDEHRQRRLIAAGNVHAAYLNRRLTADSRQSSSSSLASTSSQDFPILRLLTPDTSPPANRSRYSSSPKTHDSEFLRHRLNLDDRRSSVNSEDELLTNNRNKPGFKALTSSRSSTPDGTPRTHRRTQSIPNIKASLSSAMVPIGLCEFIANEGGHDTIGGIQKLIKSLNIAEKRRLQRAEQERLNIHNLPPHMKQQLKNIYVY